MTPKPSLLAIDPGHREIGYAHFDGDELVDYGVKSLRRQRPKKNPLLVLRAVMKRLTEEKAPSVIAVEKNSFAHINQNLPVMQVIKIIHQIAARYTIPVTEFAPNTIKKEVCNDGRATKRDVAKFICARYPELLAYRDTDKAWRERFYSNMFDAIACGLTYLKLHGKDFN